MCYEGEFGNSRTVFRIFTNDSQFNSMTLRLHNFTGEYVIKMKLTLDMDEKWMKDIQQHKEEDDSSQKNVFFNYILNAVKWMGTNQLIQQTFLFPACNDYDHHYNLLGWLFEIAFVGFDAYQVSLEYIKDPDEYPSLSARQVVNWYKEEEKIMYGGSWDPKPLKTGVLVVLDLNFLN